MKEALDLKINIKTIIFKVNERRYPNKFTYILCLCPSFAFLPASFTGLGVL